MVIYRTPMAVWCWSCFALGRGLVNGSATFRSVCSSALGTTPSSVMNSFIHIASCEASEAAMYSDSVEDLATTLCVALLQLTAAPFKINTYPDCDLESSGSVFQLASV